MKSELKDAEKFYINVNSPTLAINYLNKKLKEEKQIEACCKNLQYIPKNKGIYFWFMNKECFDKFDKININKNDLAYSRKNESNVEYELVYIGLAGTRKTKTNDNKGTLYERIEWHLCKFKDLKSVKSGHMSSLRKTLSSLISDDLIDNDTQSIIDSILCKHFRIYYIEFEGAYNEVKDIINNTEHELIKWLKPIFNFKGNPNLRVINSQTKLIKKRKEKVDKNTKERIQSL